MFPRDFNLNFKTNSSFTTPKCIDIYFAKSKTKKKIQSATIFTIFSPRPNLNKEQFDR